MVFEWYYVIFCRFFIKEIFNVRIFDLVINSFRNLYFYNINVFVSIFIYIGLFDFDSFVNNRFYIINVIYKGIVLRKLYECLFLF